MFISAFVWVLGVPIFLGTGYKTGQQLTSCSGCIILSCASRPCVGRNGEKCKMFWNVARIDKKCCQTCEGTVLPPNQELPPVPLGDDCGTTENAICKARWNRGVFKYYNDAGPPTPPPSPNKHNKQRNGPGPLPLKKSPDDDKLSDSIGDRSRCIEVIVKS